MTTKERIADAWDQAQGAFRAMLDAGVYADPDAVETMTYIAAERYLDGLLIEARWGRSRAALDALIAADQPTQHIRANGEECDCNHLNREFTDPGDHHIGVGL